MKNSRRSYKTNPNFLPDKIRKCGCGKKADCYFDGCLTMERDQLPDVSSIFEVYHLEVCISNGDDVLMIAGVFALSCRTTELWS